VWARAGASVEDEIVAATAQAQWAEFVGTVIVVGVVDL
jgi:hypothetical protein